MFFSRRTLQSSSEANVDFTYGYLIETVILVLSSLVMIWIWIFKPEMIKHPGKKVLYIVSVTIVLVFGLSITAKITENSISDGTRGNDSQIFGHDNEVARDRSCDQQNALNTPIRCRPQQNNM